MCYRRFWAVSVLAAALLSLRVDAADVSPAGRIDPADLKNIMLVKDIKAGMKGYGKTVFRGTKVESFQVEVLGVLKKVNFGTDLILVKMTGGPMTGRGANLIQGMSGSPVYINGKIIGAFAFGEIFVKEPIGMVTPIEYMLDAWDPKLPSKPSSFFPFQTAYLDKPIALGGRSFGEVTMDFGFADQPAERDSGTLVFRPLSTPLLVSGMSPRILSWLEESFKHLNVRAVAGPGRASDKANLPVDLQPGSAAGVSIVTGDLDVTGIGTVTYRRGNRILAFGHPMFNSPMMNGLGALDAQLTSAWVYEVAPNTMVSSKIAGPVKGIGRVFQDRPWSVGAEIGKLPEMIPVTVHVNDQSLSRKRDFHIKVIKHPMLASNFIVAATAEAVFEMRGSPSDATARMKIRVDADEVGPITRENIFFDPVSIDLVSVSELNHILNMLQFNPFYPVGVKQVDVWVDIAPKHQTARLERIFLKEGKFKPGETVEVGAVLKPFKGERITKSVKLELPKNMPSGQVSLEVRGGTSPSSMMMMMQAGEGPGPMPGPGIQPGVQPTPTIENLQQLVKKFLERDKNNELVARIILPKPVPSIAGEKLSGLPPSIAEAMKSTKATMIGAERDEIKQVLPTDWVILGSQRLSISVEKVEKREKKAPEKRPPSEEPPSGPSEGEPESDGMEGAPSEESEMVIVPAADWWDTFSAGEAAAKPIEAEMKAEPVSAADSGKVEAKPADESKTKKEAAPAEEKPVGRAPTTWKQTTRTEFQAGTLKKVAATTGDLLTLSGAIEPFFESTETYVWCLAHDGQGSLYAGTGNHGIIYKVAADGTASVFYDSDQLEVHSLAVDPSGMVYAGTSPNGIVYRIAPDGKASVLFDAPEKYVVALALNSKGGLYAAAGDKCKVYKIAPDGKSEPALDTSESHALSLAVDKGDNLYVGTGLNGIIYKVSPAGAVSILYDAAEESVTALAVAPDGALYAGTSPKGVVYKLAPGATPKVIYDKAGKGISGISIDKSDVYAINAGGVFKITSDEKVSSLPNEHDLQFLSLAVSDGALCAGTGNAGSIYRAEIGSVLEGTYESPVHDCGLESSWGSIDWNAELPQGASVSLQTRTGYVAEPDSTWSEWSPAYGGPGAKIESPPGRYIQYLATLKTEAPSAAPKLKEVGIVYMPRNQAPKVTLASPKGGEKWSKKKTLKWTGSDPDKDTLTYELFYSEDNGETWKALDKVKASPPETKEAPEEEPAEDETGPAADEAIKVTSPDPEKMMEQMAAELEKHPEIPEEMKDKIIAEAPAMMQQEIGGPPADGESEAKEEPAPDQKPSGNGTKQTSFSWDTTKVKDGTYIIKVVGSDRLSNPVDALSGEAISDPVVISNAAPKVYAFKKTLTVLADKSVRVEGVAYTELAGLAGVQYKTGADDWASAAAADGIFDSAFETFTLTTLPLSKGEHAIEVKAIDQAGNSATIKVTAKIE
jgi:hypothetical protein